MPPVPLRLKRTLLAATAAFALSAAPAVADSAAGGMSSDDAPATEAAPSSTAPDAPTSSSTPSKRTIRSAQRKLGLKADGAIGARTRAALRRFQRREDLEVTGRLDDATLEALGLDAADAAAATASEGTAASTDTGSGASPAGPAPTGAVAEQLEAIAECESGGDPTAVSPSGQYHGKYQFSLDSWQAVGGTGDPAAAPEAEQDARAAKLLDLQGPGAWPVCSKRS